MAVNLTLTHDSSMKWILDSGASHHMVGNPDFLHNKVTLDNAGHVQLQTGDSAKVSHIGDCNIREGDILSQVLCMPSFQFNLMSISQVTKYLNCYVTFFPQYSVFQDILSGKVKVTGKEEMVSTSYVHI